jgi:hypothetical protein
LIPSSLPPCVSVASTELTRGSFWTSRPRPVAWASSAA